MKRITFLVLVLFAFAPARLVKTKVNDDITVSLPSSFVKMAEDDIIVRSTMVRAPLGAYTNLNRDVEFVANISPTQWPDADMEVAAKFFKSNIYNLYDRVDMISSGIQIVRKKKYIFYEFESRINGNKMKESERIPVYRYSFVQYYVTKGRTLVFTFSCPKDQREEWQATAHAIMKSLKVK
ncbi:MAG: hypothetical protein OJF59_002008 [Cytophagales bacterium]|jgi:hypothetical protein|nr:hypothetical protein [Bacteroidota bacterium]MBS1980904.1 hypothetical protein [Bacteroidota bacterium]WHZ08255.1 MAG: hypothetical protein OJF59_002008 [Cytophagales bacterium]